MTQFLFCFSRTFMVTTDKTATLVLHSPAGSTVRAGLTGAHLRTDPASKHVIYSLRNKEVKEAARKVWGRIQTSR